jgi:hypothetical protein
MLNSCKIDAPGVDIRRSWGAANPVESHRFDFMHGRALWDTTVDGVVLILVYVLQSERR